MDDRRDRRSRQVGRVCTGMTLVFAPLAILFLVYSQTHSAIGAAAAGLGLSPVLQLLAEHFRPMRPPAPRSTGRLWTEIFQGIAYGSLLGVGVVFGIWWAVMGIRAALGIEVVLGGGTWVQATVLVVVADFFDYFRHRHEHESQGLFWHVHSVHHSIRDFSLLSGLALHPLETVFTYASYGLVAGVLGVPFDAMVLGFAIALIVMGAQHTNTDTSLGWLSSILAHADVHRWHHDIALESGRNVNYANVLSVWDHLWGSFYAPRDFDGQYGIRPFVDAYPTGLVDQLLLVVPGRYARAESLAKSGVADDVRPQDASGVLRAPSKP